MNRRKWESSQSRSRWAKLGQRRLYVAARSDGKELSFIEHFGKEVYETHLGLMNDGRIRTWTSELYHAAHFLRRADAETLAKSFTFRCGCGKYDDRGVVIELAAKRLKPGRAEPGTHNSDTPAGRAKIMAGNWHIRAVSEWISLRGGLVKGRIRPSSKTRALLAALLQ